MNPDGPSPAPPDRFRTGVAPVNGVEIAFDEFGDPADRPLLVVPGLGTQRVYWHEDLTRMLAERGLRVIRMDNRDTGESTILSDLGTPPWIPMMLGLPIGLRYRISDMARDAVGLLDHLGVERAHLVGFSMGGMISQKVAVDHPGRVGSLCSIMSRTGRLSDSLPGGRQLLALMRRAPTVRDEYLTYTEALGAVIGSPAYPQNPERLREIATEAFRRGLHPDGTARQLHAINAQRDRARALSRVEIPSLVIHGSADRLVFPRGGRHTADVIPGSRLRIYEGMGHDLPEQLWPRFVDEIVSNIARATR
ncbi:MAG: alpha/beta fold hydrolase [Solirubrobacterales bacterium]|nr:alpha/beta fold hydrolase [Solirubrobacterales bacterium]